MTIEYGRKPYISKSYYDMMNNITDKQIADQILVKQSEMKKPYLSDSYEEMEHFFPPIYGHPPIETPFPTEFPPVENPIPWFNPNMPHVDVPWMKMKDLGINCAALFKKLFSGINSAAAAFSAIGQYRAKGCPMTDVLLCGDKAIAYTTLQMQIDESQTLYANDIKAGLNVEWELSGGGSLSTSFGSSTVYTAPHTNANCEDNPTITLKCEGMPVSVIKIAVNAAADTGVLLVKRCHSAWTCVQINPGPPPRYNEFCPVVYVYYVSCSGVESYHQTCGGGSSSNVTACTFCAGSSCSSVATGSCSPAGYDIGAPQDNRTTAQKTAGCCPAQLL